MAAKMKAITAVNPVQAANQSAKIAIRTLRQNAAANRIAARSTRRQNLYEKHHPNAVVTGNTSGSIPQDTSLNTPQAAFQTSNANSSTNGTNDTGGILDLNGSQTAANVAATDSATPPAKSYTMYIIIGVVAVVGVVLFIKLRK
jgi:cobalamin biosynthesis Mg chelatase CobN